MSNATFQYCNTTALKAAQAPFDFIYFGGLTNDSHALIDCCFPERVEQYDGCAFCVVPQNYQNNGTGSSPDVGLDYKQCLSRLGENTVPALEFVPGNGTGDLLAPPISGVAGYGSGYMGNGVMGIMALVAVFVARG